MACKRMKRRNIKRQKLIDAFSGKRALLKKVAANKKGEQSYEAVLQASADLQKLKRDSSPTRQRNRCAVCGRPRGYLREFDLCRIHFREFAVSGFLPGIRMSSW